MAPTYCVVKLFQKATYERSKRTINGYGESNDSNENHLQTKTNYKVMNKCRICLKDGDIPLFHLDGSSDIINALKIVADISINKDDMYPKYLCKACHKLLQGAILLRKTVKKSNKILETYMLEGKELDVKDFSDNEKSNKNENKNHSILKRFFLPVYTNSHVNKGTKKAVRKVQCQICYKVITKSYYKEHFSLHELTPVKHVCHVCGKVFRLKSAHRTHLLTHSTDFPFKCHLCPYRGKYSSLLNTHMQSHRDYRYKCIECPAKFRYKCNLNKHSLRHKEPMFQCGECKRTFYSRLLADRHYKVEHLGIKNHICQLCGKLFGYRKAMMRHQLDVHKRKKKLNGRTPSYLEVEYLNEEYLN